MSATNMLNLYAELFECYTKGKYSVWVNLRIYVHGELTQKRV